MDSPVLNFSTPNNKEKYESSDTDQFQSFSSHSSPQIQTKSLQ